MLQAKYKKCKVCFKLFRTFNSFQKTCGKTCSVEQIKDKPDFKKKVTKPSDTVAGQVRLTQDVFNNYIRLRDKNLPCISCGKDKVSAWHAGHFIPVGVNKSIRFDENNVHKQCMRCNTFLHGNDKNYELNLRIKIGDEEVDRLKSNKESKKYTIPDMKELRKHYRKLIKELSEE